MSFDPPLVGKYIRLKINAIGNKKCCTIRSLCVWHLFLKWIVPG